MIDRDTFDGRLALALREFAAEAPDQVDAVAFAQRVARDYPRRSRWSQSVLGSRANAVRWAIVGALLILGSLLAILGAGAWLRDRDVPTDPGHALPVALRGEFEGNGPGADARGNYGLYRLDLRGDSVVRIQEPLEGTAHARNGVWGSVEDWVGRISEFVAIGDALDSTAQGEAELTIVAPAPCGSARYRLEHGPSELRLFAISDGCPERVAILTRTVWARVPAEVTAGRLQHSFDFSEPFQFTPARDAGAMQVVSSGDLRFNGGPYWSVWLFDDVPVMVDVCDPAKGRLDDVPATTEAVGAWLRSSSRLAVSNETPMTADGRAAIRFDTEPSEACESFGGLCDACDPGPREGAFRIGHRIYAIPTGDDTIIAVVEVDGIDPNADAFAEGLVTTMTFDR